MLTAAKQLLFSGTSTGLRGLTLANVITDATRRAAVEGDGLSVPGGFGVWPEATNRNTNGNATTNTTGVTDNSSTTTRVTTGTVKFGTTAFEVVSGNAAANEGPSQAISGGAAATAYTVSAWAWLVSGAATVRATLQDNVSGKQGGTGVVLTATPQRITVSATTGAGAVTFNSFIETTAQQAGTWRCGGWQVETGSIATPYIETDGGTAARSAARAQVAVQGLFTATQGAVAMRLNPGWGTGNEPSGGAGYVGLFEYAQDADHRVRMFYDEANNRISQERFNAADPGNAYTAWAPASGTPATLLGAWTASTVYSSVNGSARVSAAQSNIPTITDSSFDLGSNNKVNATYGGIAIQHGNTYWAITFKGTPTDADAALPWMTQNAVPTLSQIAQLSAASKPTLLVPADTSRAILLPAYFGGVL